MTQVRTFRAGSMQEALQRVREELGGDAVILHTRQTEHRRLLPWLRPRQEVEITAGLGVNVRPPLPRRRPESDSPDASDSARMAQHPLPTVRRAPEPPAPRFPQPQVAPSQPAPPQSVSAFRIDLTTPDEFTPPPVPARPAPRPAAVAAAPDFRSLAALVPSAGAPTEDLARQLETIRRMLENLGQTAPRRSADDLHPDLLPLYMELTEADVEEEIARDLVLRLRQSCTPSQLADPAASRALLTAMVESEIRCCDPIGVVRGRRKVVALVGATGVGKTTTIAKLAANFRLREQIRMGLVTVDTYRIAAIEQLRTYAEIIDLPMKVVTSPLDMRRALDELTGLDLVLIDTAGRSPRDELQIQELKRLLAEARVDEVHLVLSLTGSLRSLEAAVEKFSPANITSLVLTKVDEAAGAGTLLSLARKVRLPISYLTTGQDVPEDIEPARPSRLARLILGQERAY